MKETDRTNGFSLVWIVLTGMCVVLLLAAGWYVWRHSHAAETGASNGTRRVTGAKSTGPGGAKADSPAAADFSEDGTYLVIKEWGVRFLLPDTLRGDVSYGIRTASDGTQVASFVVGAVARLPSSTCKLTNSTGSWSGKTGGIGAELHRTTQALGTDQIGAYAITNVHIGDAWYSGLYGKYADACAGSDAASRQRAHDTGYALTRAFAGLERLK